MSTATSSKALLVCNLSPDAASTSETLSSVHFAARAAQVCVQTARPTAFWCSPREYSEGLSCTCADFILLLPTQVELGAPRKADSTPNRKPATESTPSRKAAGESTPGEAVVREAFSVRM